MKHLIIGILLLTAFPLRGGFLSGSFDTKKGTVTIRVIRPAEHFLKGKTMRVSIGSAPKSFTRQTELLSAVERSLSSQFVRAESGEADLHFAVDVVAYEPPNVREYEVQEKRRIQIGETPLYNKDGTPKKGLFGGQATQPIYEERFVPIGYWEGKGRLAIRLSVTPRGSSAAIDSATATAEFSEKRKTSDPVPDASLMDTGREIGRMFGFGKKEPEQSRQTADSLDLQFVEQVSGKSCGRFAKTVSEVAVVLSTEDVLSSGTALAQAGDWPGAIRAWDQVAMKNANSEWMRQYNLGLGNIALAFHSYDQGEDASQAAAMFEKGGELLMKASTLKPNERHVSDALRQYASFKSAMQNMASENAAREESEKRALAGIAEQRDKVLRDKRPDSPKEAAFRQLVALRLKGAKGELAAAEQMELAGTGQKGYGLTQVQAQRVVFQENDRIVSAASAVDTYEQTLASLAEDGEISSEERGVLQDLARNLAIPKSSLDVIHKRHNIGEPAAKSAPALKSKNAKN